MRSTAWWTLPLVMSTMMGALGIDTYLPSFHAIAEEFGTSAVAVQQTLSAYVLAMAITMLFYGALSDALGRRRVLLFSACGYALISLAAGFAPSIEALIALRFAQGAMAGAGMVITRAIVQDRFHGADAQRMMSLVMFCFGLAPALGPVLGGWLQAHGGWRTTFWFLSFFGCVLSLLCWRVLPESLPPEKRTPLQLRAIARNYVQALSNGQFRLMVAGVALMAGGTSIYLSSAAEFVMVILQLPVTAFGWLFIPLIAGTMVGSALSGFLARCISGQVQRRIGYGFLLLGCTSNVLYHLGVDMPTVPWAVLPITCYTLGTALLMPLLSMQIMGMFPHMRGLASSLQGFTQMGIFAVVAGAVVPHIFHSGLALAVAHSVIVLSGLCLLGWAGWRVRAVSPAAAVTQGAEKAS